MNNAVVEAVHDQPITLTSEPKGGTGHWIASHRDGDGQLIVDCEIDLNGGPFEIGANADNTKWHIRDVSAIIELTPNASFTNWNGLIKLRPNLGTLKIDHPLPVAWDFLLTGGRLTLTEDFQTSGNLEMTGGTLTLMEGKAALFDW